MILAGRIPSPGYKTATMINPVPARVAKFINSVSIDNIVKYFTV